MPISDINIKTLDPQPILAIRTKTDDIGKALGQLLPEIAQHLGSKGIEHCGMPLSIWYDCTDGVYDMDAAIPVLTPVDGKGQIRADQLPGGRAATVIYTGHYNGLPGAWSEFMQAMKNEGLEGSGDPWEIYLTDPEAEPNPKKWQTELVYPLKS